MPAKRQCQYGAGCYRKNPQHFAEYAHKHRELYIAILSSANAPLTTHPFPGTVSDIRDAGRCGPNGTYIVPDSLFMSREIVLEQLQILDRLGPADNTTTATPPTTTTTGSNDGNNGTPAKRPKIENAADTVASTSTAPAVITIDDDEEADTTPGAITAVQLQQGLAELTKKVANKTATTTLPTQTDQLAAYRARHSQQKAQQQPKTSAPAPPTTSTATTSSGTVDPHSRPPPKNIQDYISVVNPRGQMAAKLAAAAPYNFFLTTITASQRTHAEPLSITFQGKSVQQ